MVTLQGTHVFFKCKCIITWMYIQTESACDSQRKMLKCVKMRCLPMFFLSSSICLFSSWFSFSKWSHLLQKGDTGTRDTGARFIRFWTWLDCGVFTLGAKWVLGCFAATVGYPFLLHSVENRDLFILGDFLGEELVEVVGLGQDCAGDEEFSLYVLLLSTLSPFGFFP